MARNDRVSEGTLSEVTPLGLEPDAPGSMLLVDDATSLQICGRTPRSYDGCDVRVQAPADAKLLVQLAAIPPRCAERRSNCRWRRSFAIFTQFDLDDRGNRLLAQRSPGDALRVEFCRALADLQSGREVRAGGAAAAAGADRRTRRTVLSASLGPARTEDELWSEDREVRADGERCASAIAAVRSAAASRRACMTCGCRCIPSG